jgi:hypothetical protein
MGEKRRNVMEKAACNYSSIASLFYIFLNNLMMWYVKGEDIIPPKEGMGMELENDLIIMQ